jgi:hypothetical protein
LTITTVASLIKAKHDEDRLPDPSSEATPVDPPSP